MIRYVISFVLLILLSLESNAQFNHIVHQGKIEYEFKINRFERARKLLSVQASSTKYRDYVLSLQNNRFLTRKYQMGFDKKYSSYKLTDKEELQDFIDLSIGVPTTSVVRDMETDSTFVKKQFGEESFFIADKSKKIKWKYTDERMDIMGYECRRANGLFMDSIYVVAFYCPEIEVPSGPSLFGGLPGMILGVSLPQDHINIFATAIDINDRPSLKSEIFDDSNKQQSFSEFGKYFETILGSRFDSDQWDFNMRGIRF